MAAAAMTSLDSLPDEIVLKIIKMAALMDKFTFKHTGLRNSHKFIMDVLFKVSVRFRRLATDSSLWKGHVSVSVQPDFRELDFVIRECLNSRTSSMEVIPVTLPDISLPNHYLIDLATKCPNLKNFTYCWKASPVQS